MLVVLWRVARLLFSSTVFELAGAALVVAGVWTLAGLGWALIAAGGLFLAKSFDLALERS